MNKIKLKDSVTTAFEVVIKINKIPSKLFDLLRLMGFRVKAPTIFLYKIHRRTGFTISYE